MQPPIREQVAVATPLLLSEVDGQDVKFGCAEIVNGLVRVVKFFLPERRIKTLINYTANKNRQL